MSKFYRFHQNNSGGGFDHDPDKGIGYEVVIEADSANQANNKAESIGLYFDGYGDCPCCGNRWSSAYEGGDWNVVETLDDIKGGWDLPSYVHFKDGTVKAITEQRKW